jgi:23S rRNA (guanosine2251-2'-O)-methyltransferase
VIVYGRNPVREALRGRRKVRRIWAAAGAAKEPWLQTEEVEASDDLALTELSGTTDHQGICAEVSPYEYADADSLLEPEEALVLVLDEIQDPRNLGAICRVAEVGGAAGVVIPERRAAEVTAVACKASAGAVEHLPIARVRNVADWLGQAKDAGAWVYGASGDGIPYDQPDYSGKVVLVLGSEGRGLRPRVAAVCDQLVALPVRGMIGSLNVSAAAAALVYGILQFRGKKVDKAP